MKDFTKLKIPLADRIEVNSREGKLLNKAFWAAIASVVRQVNGMMEKLLGGLNTNLPLWGKGEEIDIYFNAADGDDEYTNKVIRHNLGVVPTRYIVVWVKPLKIWNAVGTLWNPNSTLEFYVNPYPAADARWTDKIIIIRPNEHAADFHAHFKVWLLP